MGKLKVLCLHGYRQNGKIFRERSGGFRKLFKKHIDFTFVTAPHDIPEDLNLARPEEERERGWWFSRPGKTYHAMDKTEICTGYEESLQAVKEVFRTEGPFDGVFGFSQGASFGSLLCTLRDDPTASITFKFAILVAGFRSQVAPHSALYCTPIECPSFHTIGSTDGVIPTQSSEDLLTTFVNAVAYRHDGGHYIPSSPQLRTAVLEFLAPFTS
jgi:predicted esterase